MQHHRAAGLLGRELPNASRIVPDATGGLHLQPLAASCRQPAHQPAIAEANDANPLPSLPREFIAGSDIYQRRLGIQPRPERTRLLGILALILQLDPALEAVEERRRNHQKSVLGIPVRHAANMRIDAEYLLNQNDRANRLTGGTRHISAQLVAVLGPQL